MKVNALAVSRASQCLAERMNDKANLQEQVQRGKLDATRAASGLIGGLRPRRLALRRRNYAIFFHRETILGRLERCAYGRNEAVLSYRRRGPIKAVLIPQLYLWARLVIAVKPMCECDGIYALCF